MVERYIHGKVNDISLDGYRSPCINVRSLYPAEDGMYDYQVVYVTREDALRLRIGDVVLLWCYMDGTYTFGRVDD